MFYLQITNYDLHISNLQKNDTHQNFNWKQFPCRVNTSLNSTFKMFAEPESVKQLTIFILCNKNLQCLTTALLIFNIRWKVARPMASWAMASMDHPAVVLPGQLSQNTGLLIGFSSTQSLFSSPFARSFMEQFCGSLSWLCSSAA